MSRIVVNNPAEAQFVKESLLTLLEVLDEDIRSYYDREIQIITQLAESSIEITSSECELSLEENDPQCCGCGACKIQTPLSKVFIN